MFETVSDYPEYSHAELFRLNPINQFLIKKYPREEDKVFYLHIGMLTTLHCVFLKITIM